MESEWSDSLYFSTASVYPSDAMARVSSIHKVFKPGLYRMEVALGDLGFDWDVAEAAMRKVVAEVAEPETPPEEPTTSVPTGTPLTQEDFDKIVKQTKEVYPTVAELPTVATHTTAPYTIPDFNPSAPPTTVLGELLTEIAKTYKAGVSMIVSFFKGLFK